MLSMTGQAGQNTIHRQLRRPPGLCLYDPRSAAQPADCAVVDQGWASGGRNCESHLGDGAYPNGEISPAIELHDWAAKKSGGRLIPIHPELRDALSDLRTARPWRQVPWFVPNAADR